MNTIKKTTKNIAKSNRTIANRFESDEQDLFLDKKGSTVMKDIAKTNNYIAKRLSIVTDDSDILNTSTPPTDENSFVTAGNIRDIYNVPYGIVGLNGSGLIDAAQLPSYVDDTIEGYYYNGAFYSDSSHQYEIVPESGKIYVDITDPDHAQSYRWTGSTYILIGCSSFNDLEPEATFNLIYNAFTDTYTVTCNKRASDLSNSPLIEVSMLGDTYKEVAFKSVSTVTAYFNIGTKIMTFAFTDNGYSWSVVYKESTVAVTGSYNDLDDKPIPTPTQADSGKLLSVDANGDYELITIVNSENIAY